MAAPMERTKTPGIFKRGSRYVVVYKVNGRQRKESARTYDEARRLKRSREADRDRGDLGALSKVTFHSYAREWIDRYQGTGKRGFREETRDEYRRLLERYALRYFGPRVNVAEITPRQIADYLGWLVQQPSRRGGTLSDSSVHNAFKPLAACLATARREGLIRHNPAAEATMPHRPRVEDDEDKVRPFPPGVMEMVVAFVHPRHRLMLELLAATGVRRSELIALQGKHLKLDGGDPLIRVRQRVRRMKGKGLVVGALKSRYARRDLPIPLGLADRLRALQTPAAEFVFTSQVGTVIDPDNVFERVLRPACEEAGAEWAGFHTFRHTVASRLFAQGRNVVQVQKWLGHHSPSFTLDTYVHLLDGDLGGPLGVATPVATEATESARNTVPLDALEIAA
ncbi:MAG TPA: site-specific integrase [Thermoleophilaceae bacterium]|nr:site-specific integrase [Thermoleophilaceae bacterium]